MDIIDLRIPSIIDAKGMPNLEKMSMMAEDAAQQSGVFLRRQKIDSSSAEKPELRFRKKKGAKAWIPGPLYSEEWGEWVRTTLLLDIPHRQVVLTIPKTLRIFFKFLPDRVGGRRPDHSSPQAGVLDTFLQSGISSLREGRCLFRT